MNRSHHYTDEAIERIQHMGEVKIASFVNEVSDRRVQALRGFLPDVTGFRKASKPGLQRQKQVLSRVLATSSREGRKRDKAFSALYEFWRAWGIERLGDPNAVGDCLVAIERDKGNGSANSENDGAGNLFRMLKLLSQKNLCSRELIERFLAFSPFSVTDEIQEAANSAKSEADIERDKAASTIPERLKRDEEELDKLRAEVADMASRIQMIVRGQDTIAAQLSAITTDVASSKLELTNITQTFSDADELLGRLTSDIELQAQKLLTATSEVRKVSSEVSALSEMVFSNDPSPKFSEIFGRIEKLEKPGEQLSEKIELREDISDNFDYCVEPNLALRIPAESVAKQAEFTDLAGLINALKDNLIACGLKKTAAGIFAEEICATFLASQCVILKGSLANITATAIALAVSGSDGWRLSVPADLLHATKLRKSLEVVRLSSHDCVSALIVEGINRVPIDIVQEAVLEARLGPTESEPTKALTICTVVNGAATLPVEPDLIHLGPVFDVDHLDWRIERPTKATIWAGRCTSEQWGKLIGQARKSPPDLEEVRRLAERFSPRPDRRALQAFATAYCILSALRPDASPTPMQSLAFGWLAPWWSALHVSMDDVDSEFDGGKMGATSRDDRLKSIVNSWEWGRTSSDVAE